ncbi:MAG: helix-turn-helix transcriptional regulator [Alphaproteobacteria bacterium]
MPAPKNPVIRTGKPNPVDIHVGSRIRLRRTLLGLSQEKLGEAIGLTFQQIQKYERGANRVGASRLYALSQVLDVPVAFFYDDMPAEVSGKGKGRTKGIAGLADGPQAEFSADPLAKRETLELVRAYYRIKDSAVRKRLFDLAKSLANASQN